MGRSKPGLINRILIIGTMTLLHVLGQPLTIPHQFIGIITPPPPQIAGTNLPTSKRWIFVYLLDLYAAIKTIDHSILHHLSSWFGISGTALDWFETYLSSSTFSLNGSDSLLSHITLTCGVPQGSVFEPKF